VPMEDNPIQAIHFWQDILCQRSDRMFCANPLGGCFLRKATSIKVAIRERALSCRGAGNGAILWRNWM
jgi:hypothetical protein